MKVNRLYTILLVSFLFSATASAQELDSGTSDRNQKGSIDGVEKGSMRARNLQPNQLVEGKTAKVLKAVMGKAEKRLKLAIEADPENLRGKSELGYLYMDFANSLEEQSPERLEYLIKADETFREIIENDGQDQVNAIVQFNALGPSVQVRKQLAALDSETYSIDALVERVRAVISDQLQLVNDYKVQNFRHWLILIKLASEIGQFDVAVDIADQGIKVVTSQEGQAKLAKAKSFTLKRAALTINNFDEFESYRDRFIHLCDAVRADPREPSNYLLLLEYVGKENPKPTIQHARKLGLTTPGNAVPIKPEWLRRISLEVEYTVFIQTLIGFEEFHLGNNETALKSWGVAQRSDRSSREFITMILEVTLLAKLDKLDNLETMLSEALIAYPDALRIRVLRGLYYTTQLKYQAAIDDYRIVLRSKPNEVLLHQRIKSCYQSLEQPKAAAEEQHILDAKIQRLPEASRIRALEMIEQMKSGQATTP